MTTANQPETASSGIRSLDELLQGMRLEDNVVWQVDSLDDYAQFCESLVSRSVADGLACIYVRFADHSPVVAERPGLKVIDVDPSPGFDYFSSTVHRIIEENGKRICYIFDNLSDLVNKWATDELLANFFQVTCPFLYELDTLTYFALTRNQHSMSAIARIRDTTQVLLDVYHVNENVYVHPLKVWDRYSSQMFLPHLFTGDELVPVFRSGDAASVSTIATRSPIKPVSGTIAPWDSVYGKLKQYRGAPAASLEGNREVAALREELSRMLFGNHPVFGQLVDRYLEVDDLLNVRDRMVGSGRIGGKAAGMLVARKVLQQPDGELDFTTILEEHDSFFLGSDVFFTFLVNNNLFRLRLELSRASRISREEFEKVEEQFLAGTFPNEIVEQFRDVLDYFGQAPIIVRSSSLLEDNFGNAFAGKYRSEFCANQGNPDDRLEAFMRAVKLVYASALNPDALAYRKKRGIGDSDEQMAVLVQRVSGTPYRRWFFPALAGVAFSHNLYAWTSRIDAEKGMLRLVYGLGTRAVNRVDRDYPRMIAVSHPGLRPETGLKVAKYSQKFVDVLNLESNKFETVTLAEVMESKDYPNLNQFVSVLNEGYIEEPMFGGIEAEPRSLVLTFNNLLQNTKLVKIMEAMLARLEATWGQPVDTEFTAFIEKNGTVRVNLLQCRPLRVPHIPESLASLPENIEKERVLFRSDQTLSGGVIDGIRYLIYIDAEKYAAIPSESAKRSLGRVVGRLNEVLRERGETVVAIGPGRWGSSNIDLGINVSYADIDAIRVLVEVGLSKAGHDPELSYGTHFFQDLVEADIIYLPVYPDRASTGFNTRFFNKAKNALVQLCPDDAEFADYIKVIDVPMAAAGKLAHVIADAQKRQAIAYLE